MSPFVQQLLDAFKVLAPAPGTPPEAVRDALRALATVLFSQDPAQANVPLDGLDPIIVDVIQVAAQQAAALKAAGVHPRVNSETLPVGSRPANVAERAAQIFGPLVIAAAETVRFVCFQSAGFRTVSERLGGGGGVPTTAGELWMLLPQESKPDPADNLTWILPAGTVWIESRFLLAGAVGFTGLRIAGGTLRSDANPSVHGSLLINRASVWTLSVQPEPPPPADAGGTDAAALNLQLPALLEVHSNRPPNITGDLTLSGFGSDLHLTPSGTVFPDTREICFSLQAAEAEWSIAGNLSPLTQFSGASSPFSPRFTLPITNTPPEQLGEAAHGGSIVITFNVGLTSKFLAQSGDAFRWSAATLTANAARLEIHSLVPDSGARYDLGLWGTSVSEVRFVRLPLTGLTFHSERGGFETVGVSGGSCVNKWDLPRRADGPPFDFNGVMDVFGFLSSPAGPLLTVSAIAPPSSELAGFALENLYVIVRPTRNLFLLAVAGQAPLLPAGNAELRFDVNVAMPTLPDPYAANLGPPPSFDGATESALRLSLVWSNSQTPALTANLDQNVRFPEPRFLQLDDVDEQAVYRFFTAHLQSQTEFLYLLDLSSREHLFGVAFESPSDNKPEIVENRLSVQLNRVRLLLQPQVQWEPVRFVPGPEVVNEEAAHSMLNGGPTLVGANSIKLTPVLPARLSDEIMAAIPERHAVAALFSLPFGLRAAASLDFVPFILQEPSPATIANLNEPVFDGFRSARQIRLFARSLHLGLDPARFMPGIMRQLANLVPNSAGLTSVLPNVLRDAVTTEFGGRIPLHHADLSGYGLSTFSEWHQEDIAGPHFTKIEFRVLNGRTAYEVVQFRSILYECGARVIRTVVLERHNSGWVNRIDTGWVATEDGAFQRPIPFQNGALQSFSNIRRIRVAGAVIALDGTASVQPVIFDADANIDGGLGGPVPIYDRPGYVHLRPPPPPPVNPVQLPPPTDLSAAQLKLLYDKVHAIGGPADCAVRIGGTLEAQISNIVSDVALDDFNDIGFAVALVGTPKLPRAGQWTVVRVDPVSGATSAVDPRRGVPFVRNGAAPFRFREPSDTRLKDARVEYALLMATETSRALFAAPSINQGAGILSFDGPPLFADPYSLVQSTGAFPRPNFGLRVLETPSFQITPENVWRIDTDKFTPAAPPVGDFMNGSGWGITRAYDNGLISLNVDSGAAAPYKLEAPISNLNLNLPDPLNDILSIRATYQSVAGGPPKLGTPDLVFSGALEKVKEIVNSLAFLTGIEFPFNVSVEAGSGPTPSFVVHMDLVFRIGDGPDGRIDIGMGKFYGQFTLRGDLQAALTGVERALLSLEFQGDIQQGILPPLLYAGGLFRFSIELTENGPPVVQLTLGVVISLGGDLIPGLIAVEATLNEGYSLIPETLDLGVLLGIEARAKLLGGLVGFSFSAEVMARIMRKNFAVCTIYAQIRVAATVQVAIFFKEDIDFQTQFHQDIPLAAVALVPPASLPVLAAAAPL
jgi:hypothetical protein